RDSTMSMMSLTHTRSISCVILSGRPCGNTFGGFSELNCLRFFLQLCTALDEMLKFFAIVFTFSLRAIFTYIEFRLAWGMGDGIFYNMSQNKLLNPPVCCTRHETVKNAC